MTNEVGRHLIIDGIFKDDFLKHMSNRNYLANFLEDVTNITGMTLVFPPIAMSFPFSGETNSLIKKLEDEGKCSDSEVFQEFRKHIKTRNTLGGGVSAIAVWVESHCTLHSWTEKNYISVDLFSCSTYDEAPVIDYVIKALGLEKGHFVIVDRHMDGTAPDIKHFSQEEWEKGLSNHPYIKSVYDI